MKSYRILVVDDNRSLRETITDIISLESGREVDTAENGREAFSLLSEIKYDLVIMDTEMPHMYGYDVCRKVRENGVRTPIVGISAERSYKEKWISSGADEFVPKDDLRLKKIENIVEKYLRK